MAEARLEAVARLAELARMRAVDAVLVAGDVLDAQGVSERTLRRLFNALAGYAGPWVMLPGNHDAALAESVWTRALRLGIVPANVHLALRPDPLLLPQAGLALLPAPLTQRHTYGDLTAWFDAAETPPALVRVGLAHGSVQGLLADAIDATNPIAADRAQSARLDYLALGDWHGCKQIDARTWYSGTPEPDRFRANDAGRALVVDIAAPGAQPQVEVVVTGHFRWQQLAAELRVPSDLDVLIEIMSGWGPQDVIDLTLTGQLDLGAHQRLAQALAAAEAQTRQFAVDRDRLHLLPSDDELAGLQADGYLGELLAELRAAQASDDEAALTARDALALLGAALAARHAATTAAVASEASA